MLRALIVGYGARTMQYLANVLAAKATAYAIPLMFASFLKSNVYGTIEFTWSSSSFLATVASFGVPAALPQLALLRRPIYLKDVLAVSFVIQSIASLSTALTFWYVSLPHAAVLVLAWTPVALAQASLGVYCRTYSYRGMAQWADGFGLYAMLLIVLLSALFGRPTVTDLIFGSMVTTVVLVSCGGLIAWRSRRPELIPRTRKAVQMGLPMLANSLCTTWAALGPRLYLGIMFGVDTVAAYSVGLRVSSIVLGLQSIVTTALFARLYRMRSREFDRLVSVYLAAMGVVCCSLLPIFPHILNHMSEGAGPDVKLKSIAMFPSVILQVFSWLAWGWLEARVNRARRAGRAALETSVMMALVAVLVATEMILGSSSPETVAQILALQMVFGVCIQFRILWSRGLKLVRIGSVFASGVLLIILTSYFA